MIFFCSRHTQLEIGWSYHIEEQVRSSESYLVGDEVNVTFYVDKAFIDLIDKQPDLRLPFESRLMTGIDEIKMPKVSIDCEVVKRKHSLLTSPKLNMVVEESLHSIILQPATDADEICLLTLSKYAPPAWTKSILQDDAL